MSGMAGLNFRHLPGLQATFADRTQSHRIDNGYLWASYAVHHVLEAGSTVVTHSQDTGPAFDITWGILGGGRSGRYWM